MDKQLQLFGLMNKAGRLAIGDEPVTDAIEVHQARVLVLASDAGEHTVRRFRSLAQSENVPFLPLPYTKEEFGAMLSMRSCAVAAVCDIGFAAKLLSLQSETHPELAEAAEKMQEKAEHLWSEQKKKRKAQEQAAKHGYRNPPPRQEPPKKAAAPKPAFRRTERENAPEDSRYGKVYGRPSGARRSQVSLGDRRREDAQRKQESGFAEKSRGFGKAPAFGSASGSSGEKARSFHGKPANAGARPHGFGQKAPAGSRTQYQNKPFRGRSGRANGGNAK